MRFTAVVFLFLISTFSFAKDVEVVDQGSFRLLSKTSSSDFHKRLLDLGDFAEVYERENDFTDYKTCGNSSRYSQVVNGIIEVCSQTRMLGYKVVVDSRIEIESFKDSSCDNGIHYKLYFARSTRPALVWKNVSSANTYICLDKSGSRVKYTTNVVKGDRPSLLFYRTIRDQIASFTPYLVKSIQETLR